MRKASCVDGAHHQEQHPPRDVVADFFMGSGSTIKAALKLGRKAIGVELEEERYLQTVSEIEKQ